MPRMASPSLVEEVIDMSGFGISKLGAYFDPYGGIHMTSVRSSLVRTDRSSRQAARTGPFVSGIQRRAKPPGSCLLDTIMPFAASPSRLTGSCSPVGGQNKDIKIWEVTTGTELMTLLGKDQYDHHWAVCTAFCPDGIHLVSGSDIGKIKLYEVLPSGEEKIVHNGHWRDEPDEEETEHRGYYVDDHGGFQKPMEYWIGALAFTPDGKTMISGSRDCTIKFYEMPELREIRTLKGHTEWVRNLIVSRDGKVLISASDDGTVKMWDIQTGRQFRTIKEHKGGVRGICLSADGRRLATASTDRTIKLWEGGEES